ncbi:hypothetical protein R0G64_32685, partial [Pseudomonas otitidis]|nr:hypothetical protein [Pseudomonas otitidis]
SQFTHGVRWQPFEFEPTPYMGFDESLDLFGDGSVVLDEHGGVIDRDGPGPLAALHGEGVKGFRAGGLHQ